jgi:hypothetical protein
MATLRGKITEKAGYGAKSQEGVGVCLPPLYLICLSFAFRSIVMSRDRRASLCGSHVRLSPVVNFWAIPIRGTHSDQGPQWRQNVAGRGSNLLSHSPNLFQV